MVGVAGHEVLLAYEVVDLALDAERDVPIHISLKAQAERDIDAVGIKILVGGFQTAAAGDDEVLHVGEGEVTRDGIFLAIHDDLAALHGIDAVLAAVAHVSSDSRTEIDIQPVALSAVAQALGKITLGRKAETVVFYFLITIQMGTPLLIETHLGVSLLTAVRRIKVINA